MQSIRTILGVEISGHLVTNELLDSGLLAKQPEPEVVALLKEGFFTHDICTKIENKK